MGSLPVLPGNRFPGIPRRQSPVILSSEVGSAEKDVLRNLHESCRDLPSTEAGAPASPRLGTGQPQPADSERTSLGNLHHPLGGKGERARGLEDQPDYYLGSSIDIRANGDGVITSTETPPQRSVSIMSRVAQAVVSRIPLLHQQQATN